MHVISEYKYYQWCGFLLNGLYISASYLIISNELHKSLFIWSYQTLFKITLQFPFFPLFLIFFLLIFFCLFLSHTQRCSLVTSDSVPRDHSWPGSGDHMGCWEFESVLAICKASPSLLYYFLMLYFSFLTR